MTSTVAVLNNSQTGVMEVHHPACRDIARKHSRWPGGHSEWRVTITEGQTILRACQIDLAASGFASDHGMTPAQYVDAGHSHEFRVYPCTATGIEPVCGCQGAGQ